MYGEMAIYNFVLAGTVEFGAQAMDRGTMIADIGDVRKALNMENATGEILGFFNTGYYDDELAGQMASRFNKEFNVKSDQFSPVMITLKMQSGMEILVDYSSKILGIMIFVFLVAMSIVLWNAGLLGGLRRYGEFGMRLAIGEEKGHVYRTMIYESLIIGIMGSVAGVIAGMGIASVSSDPWNRYRKNDAKCHHHDAHGLPCADHSGNLVYRFHTRGFLNPYRYNAFGHRNL